MHIKTKTQKTFNDPVYGFITVQDDLIFELIEHPYFQRLRRISQLGLTNLVYGGANHSRFQHAMGAMNLMKSAIEVLRSKGIDISPEDEQASKIAILLHDIGHGPFSHALENTIVKGINHEQISLAVMNQLSCEMDHRLDRAIDIYRGTHPVHFLHQLVSSQLDTDRLDYLKRDSFFTGVSEGTIGSERLIKMLTVHDDHLAVEAKGIYSLEKFLIARRLMYWQVYLHKTVLSAEFLLMNTLLRAKELTRKGIKVPAGIQLDFFLTSTAGFSIDNQHEWLPLFLEMDDYDILSAIKQWMHHEDAVLRELSQRLVNRKLLKTKLLAEPLPATAMDKMYDRVASEMDWKKEDATYLVFERSQSSQAYDPMHERINVLFKDGTAMDISEAAAIFRFSSLDAQETKHYLYFPSFLSIP